MPREKFLHNLYNVRTIQSHVLFLLYFVDIFYQNETTIKEYEQAS